MTDTDHETDPDTPADPVGALHRAARELDRLIDGRGRISRWPKKRRQQLMLLEYIAAQIEPGPRMSERELTRVIEGLHTFGDAALIRRELVELGYLGRERDGSAYWKLEAARASSER